MLGLRDRTAEVIVEPPLCFNTSEYPQRYFVFLKANIIIMGTEIVNQSDTNPYMQLRRVLHLSYNGTQLSSVFSNINLITAKINTFMV